MYLAITSGLQSAISADNIVREIRFKIARSDEPSAIRRIH